MLPKIIVILGPTSSGKSDLAAKLAKEFNGEIVSADSRQVYKGLDIGTGKITKTEMMDVPHHLLDVVSLKKVFTVVDFQKKAYKAVEDILGRGKLPIIAGGTGFYIQSIVDGIVLPEVKNDSGLRKKLEKFSLKELQDKLRSLDSARFKKIDQKNKIRLIRAIELATKLGKIPKTKSDPKYNALQIGITWPRETLHEKISERLDKRFKAGMITEVEKLHQDGLSWKRMNELGLEYRYISQFLQNKISKEEMVKEITNKSNQYAKRQMTWFKRDKRIKWFELKDYKKIKSEVGNFV